ncbi:HAMP domain-containing sensor histidine kinase [Methylobacterium sp. NEAU 140]|uniref:sensor histidine kinase n=1 Tax=Methylobacterium sp. NEAU 140 TaxID=3064945 RepID=UPI002735834A|nr:HAMP domain-containing sensor histidine kinase [Methylobacterium sp. NEAU 140]MDP4021501.1 HAMP domain-containing sensor histidine kinase [Methylobacterium sp. NEAU 140]
MSSSAAEAGQTFHRDPGSETDRDAVPPARPPARAGAAPDGGRTGRLGLSGRLFLVTVAFVAVAEVLIYVPAVANYRVEWMEDRLAAAQVAALVLDGREGEGREPVSGALESRLLAGVNARAIAVRGAGAQRLLAIDPVPDTVADTVDLRTVTAWGAIRGAWRTLVAPVHEPIRVVGQGGPGFDRVEILLDEAPLRTAMVDYALRLLVSSLIIAASAAGLVFVVLQVLIVRPVRRLATSITAFADAPEDAERIIVPSRRSDEIGQAEVALARMQRGLADQLRQKRRLAELGLAVSKISHELRNLLTGAQLLGDRLEGTADPTVQRVAPRLVDTIARAVRFCEGTLAYGRATEPDPRRARVPLAPLFADLPDIAALAARPVAVRVEAGDLAVTADPEQLSRALANLVRNAVQALDGAAGEAPEVRVTAGRDGPGRVTILVSDNGPGLPPRARENLFAPFQGSMRSGGTGLGLPIAAELIGINGGTLGLDATEAGTRFRIVLPEG